MFSQLYIKSQGGFDESSPIFELKQQVRLFLFFFLFFLFSFLFSFSSFNFLLLSFLTSFFPEVYPEMEEVALGAFIFLRFFCPAIVSPGHTSFLFCHTTSLFLSLSPLFCIILTHILEVHGVIDEGVLTNDHRRALVLISKLLQVDFFFFHSSFAFLLLK